MPDTGYPDWQSARDFLSGLVGNQQVDRGGQLGVAGTRIIRSIPAGSTYVIRSLLVTASMEATAIGAPCFLGLTVTATQGFDGVTPSAVIVNSAWRITDNDSATDSFIVPGPISVHAAAAPNLLEMITTSGPGAFVDYAVWVTAYAVLI